ncbi:hypothetical protein [Neobacillus mesonae]|uniref:hypothetical protein n=1 Tax=Neobacillus mesonae TaxID=1193713 RepID=UPI00082F6F97|nr:hypothetical protein [Neobacillus mesonae]
MKFPLIQTKLRIPAIKDDFIRRAKLTKKMKRIPEFPFDCRFRKKYRACFIYGMKKFQAAGILSPQWMMTSFPFLLILSILSVR